MQTESTGENIASLNDAFETPKRKADQGIKTFDFLGQLSAASNQQQPAMSKQDYMRILREKRQAKFEEKRMLAQTIVQNRETAAPSKFGQVGQSDCEKYQRGQLGQPFRLFNELNSSLQKLVAVTELMADGEEAKEVEQSVRRDSLTGDAEME